MPSSVVSSFSYDPESEILTVRFTSGAVYEYVKVPFEKYEAMRKSGSKGIYLNKFIKGKHDFIKLK